MRYLAPHLRRALQVHDRLKEAYAYRSAFEDYLEGIARGAALLDACGAVIYANAALRTIVAARDGVVSASSMLSANDAVAARRLRKAVASAASGGPGGRFAIPRPSGAAPYHLLVSPLGSADAIAPNRRGVLVIISDPTRTESFDVPLLSEIYGFTPAECQIACQLANGHSAEGIADAMGIAVGTVRTHLKRVLHKTQTHRQTDLVRLLLLGRTLP
jgi:DNA-binding CsgD family transcriptional regulator